MEPTPARDVHSPKSEWRLIAVLRDGGPDQGALAIGHWNGKPVLAMRWTGTEKRPTGNPQSRGVPTWFIVPDEFVDAILRYGELSMDQVQLVQQVFGGRTIETLNGALFKLRNSEHQYQIRHLERLPYFAGRVYLVRVEHLFFLEDEKEGLSAPAPLPPAEATFRLHFPLGYKNDPVLFGAGEAGDGKHMLARLPILMAALASDPPHPDLKPGADGVYTILI